SALRTALTSPIENTKAVGLVFLPGAMTGLILAGRAPAAGGSGRAGALVLLPGAMTGFILAGADPVDAVLVQAAIMYLILGCVATNVVIIGLGLTRKLFTPDHRLGRLAPTGAGRRGATGQGGEGSGAGHVAWRPCLCAS